MLLRTMALVMKKLAFFLLGISVPGFVGGCKNAEGRFRPPDPIGYAIFEMLDRGPRQDRSSDSDFIEAGPSSPTPERGIPPESDSIWVEGTWGVSNGRRVWIPAHWQ